jgi:hypothetical protein
MPNGPARDKGQVESSPDGQERRDAWEHLAYCPNCSAKLQVLKCKARCPRCGFFQDCSDTIV